jgi:hypothetical protein
MNSLEVIKNIESKYAVEDIKADGFKLWQFLRYRYYITNYFINETNAKSAYYLSVSNNIFNLFRNTVKSYFTFRKKFKYILFTDSTEIRQIEGKMSDKIAHDIISVYGDDMLVCLNTSNEIVDTKNLFYKNMMNSMIFYFFSAFHKRKTVIENEEILKNIENEFDIKVDYQKKTDRFFSLVKVMDKYFKRNNYKIVFVDTYYAPVLQQAVVYSANKNNIKVVELQHGLINESNISYNIFRKVASDGLPQYIFLFGEYFKELLTNSKFLSPDNLKVTGSFFINHSIETNPKNEFAVEYFAEARKKFKSIVAITSQETIINELSEFLLKLAELDKDVLYIFIPRNYKKEYPELKNKTNIVIDQKLGFYTCASFVDFHSTVYSTCAVESLAFGTPNILININNLSRKFLGSNLNESNFSYFVESPEAMLETIQTCKTADRELVKSKGNFYFAKSNKTELKQFLQEIENG